MNLPSTTAINEGRLDARDAAGIQLERVARVVRRRGLLILACVLLFGAGAYEISEHQSKEYTATASLGFGTNQLSLEVAGLQAPADTDPQSTLDTNVTLVKIANIANATAAAVGHGLTGDSVTRSLSISADGDTSIVNVSATARAPVLAAEIANTYAAEFVDSEQQSNFAYYLRALALVNKQLAAIPPRRQGSAQAVELEGRAQSLQILSQLQSGALLVQHAPVPTSPSSPKPVRNALIGVLLGLVLGVGLVFSEEKLNRRITEPTDVERIYGLPLLGVVPKASALVQPSTREGQAPPPVFEAEVFHLIRAHLRYFNVDRDLQSLLVVSARQGDGKSTIAMHLAMAAARVGTRVALIEADLRHPTIANALGLRSGPGLSDVIIGTCTLDSAIQTVYLDIEPAGGGRAETRRAVDVLVAGVETPPNPAELLESHAMESLLANTRSTYELVVIDTPPLTQVSDAFPLLRKVDGVVIVARVGVSRRNVAERLRSTLAAVGAPLLGVIANGSTEPGATQYGYYYGANKAKVPASAALPPQDENASDADAVVDDRSLPT